MNPRGKPNGDAEDAISQEMLRIHRESYGHGAERVETHIKRTRAAQRARIAAVR